MANMQVSFTVETKEVRSALFALSRLAGKFSKTTIIQIRVVSSGIELSSNGITKKIETNTNGEADITLPVVLLKSYLKDGAGVYKSFIFRQGELICGGTIFNSYAIRVQPVFTHTKNVLPPNLNRNEILRYWLNKSPAEIEKAGLTNAIELAKTSMKTNILQAMAFLQQYEVTYQDLEEIVIKKIKN